MGGKGHLFPFLYLQTRSGINLRKMHQNSSYMGYSIKILLSSPKLPCTHPQINFTTCHIKNIGNQIQMIIWRIYFLEVYSADTFLKEHDKIQAHNTIGSTPEIEAVVCSIILYSDSTHLTSFGLSSLWPIYAYFRNISKYCHAKSSFSAHHLAYIPKVSAMQFYLDSINVVFLSLVIHSRTNIAPFSAKLQQKMLSPIASGS